MIRKIFAMKMARELSLMGFECIGTEPNRNKPWLNVYLFVDSPEIQQAMAEVSQQMKK